MSGPFVARLPLVTAVPLALLLMTVAPLLVAQQQHDELQPASARQRAARVLADIRDSVTLAQWRIRHPQDTVQLYQKQLVYGYAPDNWCAVSESYLPDTNGDRIWRRAIFYTPTTPDLAILPPDSRASTLVDNCRLGVVLFGFARAEAVATGNQNASPLNTLADRHNALRGARNHWLAGGRIALLDELFAIAAINGAERDYMQRVLRNEDRPGPHAALFLTLSGDSSRLLNTPQADSIAELLRQWLQSASMLSLERRIAATALADMLIEYTWPLAPYNFPQKVSPHGAIFTRSTRGSGYLYARNLLTEAGNTRAAGRGGDLAFLLSLMEAMEPASDCVRGMIRRGEEYLAQNPGTSTAADIHFLLAEAYSDIVGVVPGATEYRTHDFAAYQRDAPTARLRAIEHYRAAIALAGDTAIRSRGSWQTAYRLIAGLQPLEMHWFCEGM